MAYAQFNDSATPGKKDKTYPEISQRGFYSEYILTDANQSLPTTEFLRGPSVEQETSWQVHTTRHTPNIGSFTVPAHLQTELKKHEYGPTTQRKIKSHFPSESSKPKVQLPYVTQPGKCPRKVEIERRKRDYARQDIKKLLLSHNIKTEQLIPTQVEQFANNLDVNKASFPVFLSLEIFDDTAEGKHDWCDVGVLSYETEKKLFVVQKTKPREQVINKAATKCLVPRIRLMFAAEDPSVFAQRVAHAVKARQETEALLRYNLYIDCMPTDRALKLNEEITHSIVCRATGVLQLSKDTSLEPCIESLKQEINLDHQRAMNEISFDHTVRSMPKLFPFVTLPRKTKPAAPQTGCVETSASCAEIKCKKQNFIVKSLLLSAEVIEALGKVRAECNKVRAMSLLHSQLSKTMRLEEFEQAQSTQTLQVSMFLRDQWVTTLKHAVTNSLQEAGKGWYNLQETNWEVYLMSKICKFMVMVKFCMQDTLRYLVQDSLHGLVQQVLETCSPIWDCQKGMQWSGSVINSPYRAKRNPLFLIDLILDQTGVHYSTNPSSFETALISLFNKTIALTQQVPQLDVFVMSGLFWNGTPLLESVGQREAEVERLRASIHDAMQRACIPMVAYAEQYSKHLELMNLDVNQYIQLYDSQPHTAADVKKDVDMHLAEKEVLENTIPGYSVIGPFWVNCETLKQQLIKKRKLLANALLDLMAKKLHSMADDICDEFKKISRRLYDKPTSVEDLSEIRDWMITVPELLKELQEKIDHTVADYEVLDEFCYSLNNEDFDAKWAAVAWPYKISQQMELVVMQHEEDEERFRKVQQQDQTNFNDRLDTLQMVVAGLSGFTDMSKAHEVANEVRRIQKQLKECQELAAMYNTRERLFNAPVTNYDKLARLNKEFEPYRNLWMSVSDWLRWNDSWMMDPLTSIDAEIMEKQVNDCFKIMHKSAKIFQEVPAVLQVAAQTKQAIELFKPYIPLIQGLRNPGMRMRHWEQLSEALGFKILPKPTLTFSKCLEMGLQTHTAVIAKVGEVAGKEYSIEQALDKMEAEWEPIEFEVSAYKETGTYILHSSEESSQLLDDHIVMTQSMSFSPYKKPFEERIIVWEEKLRKTQDVTDEWLACQRSWLYLEPIFSSDDINRQLPVESKRYQTMERMWRKVMKMARDNSQVITLCPNDYLLDSLRESNKLLDQVQKGLSEYLETKRTAFPRFYFLSDDELLEILSQTKDPKAVQPHLRKCFENIAKLRFEDDLRISVMYSGEGEEVPFSESLYPTGNVEDWLLEVERVMKESLRSILERSLNVYAEASSTHPLPSPPPSLSFRFHSYSNLHFLRVASSLRLLDVAATAAAAAVRPSVLRQLDDLRELVRGDLSRLERMILSALIVIEVHARDVLARMLTEHVNSINDFEWISQLRYYWTSDNLYARAVNSEFLYGYEYLGNTGRLVITPLTDRCYLTLTGALHLMFGGAPAGPAGTGKTETTKDLAKAIAIQCVVFNCSDQLDFMAMGKFLKGLARVSIRLYAILCISDFRALFRPVAMMVPDYALIAEISLFSFGFSDAKALAKKITSTFKLSSEQLSSQDHYDFGMRAVKTVISAAGNLKRENPQMDEELIVLRAIRDVNVPKFLQDDLKLFNGIVSDLFPKIKEEDIDYGDLMSSIRSSCVELGLKDVDGFVTKCIQLYETTVVRHGLMLVGPTGSGKTRVSGM
ncbi:PREDICTED: dynein heavy chain 1, axonemal-like [Priapulus caudatus]|uniref:Dynein heavy chain 1, axonemal-like n=1 Tax=Priapulus caudatus TaxID=37621 RepID=A0ABM1E1X5_PRICU|nr:PREDICTED: dynein heavy chain 1, axonemal-like [Priapulus caudatus]